MYTLPGMIRSFGDKTTEDIYHGRSSKAALKISRSLWPRIRSKLDLLEAASTLNDLRVPPSNHLEALRGDLAGSYSIRVNDQFRIVFLFENGACDRVRVLDYH